jgi:hypothetical protein
MLFAKSGIYKTPLLRGRGFVSFKVPFPLQGEIYVGLTTTFDKPELNYLDVVYTCPFVVRFSNVGIYVYGITITNVPPSNDPFIYPMVLLFADRVHSANDIFAIALDSEQTVLFYKNFKLLYKYLLPSAYYYAMGVSNNYFFYSNP